MRRVRRRCDVMDLLMEPTVDMADELRTDPASLSTDAQSVARGLHRLVEGDLAGMFDGESTATIDWSGPGIVVDLSAVLQSPAFSSILVCAGAWLAQVVARKDRQRIIVVDECWKAIRDAGFVAWGEETQKLSRGYGVQFVTIVQRISDLASQADDGTATAERAQGFVTEAETKVTFNLSGGEAKASRDVMDWTDSETLLVPRLPRGRAPGGWASTAPSSRPFFRPGTSPCATAIRPCGATYDEGRAVPPHLVPPRDRRLDRAGAVRRHRCRPPPLRPPWRPELRVGAAREPIGDRNGRHTAGGGTGQRSPTDRRGVRRGYRHH